MKKTLFAAFLIAVALFLFSCAKDQGEAETGTNDTSNAETTAETTEAMTEYVPSRVVKIACVGDSLTYGVGASDRMTKGYPAQLQSLLGDRYEVKNFGRSRAFMIDKREYPSFTYSSDKSVAYKNTFEYKLSLQYDADIVLICLGTNDAHASNKNVDVDEKTFFYESAVALAKEYQNLPSEPTVYFVCPPSRFDAAYRKKYMEDTILPQILEAAKATECETIDIFNATDEYAANQDTQYYSSDGVHLADDGYAIFAQCVYDVVSLYRLN